MYYFLPLAYEDTWTFALLMKNTLFVWLGMDATRVVGQLVFMLGRSLLFLGSVGR